MDILSKIEVDQWRIIINTKRENNEDTEEEIRKQVRAWLWNLEGGICPVCHKKIELKIQVGHCVYSESCGHRLYQGKL